jgi:nitroreductase
MSNANRSSRRKFLKVLGGGVILAAGAGSLYATTRTPSRALQPWKLALGPTLDTDPRRIVLSHAILAPNPHNMQPWSVDLSKDNEMTLYCNLDKRLPHTDPYDRQITIGLGCFLELLSLTAKEIGYRADIRVFPEGEGVPRLDDRPIARITMTRDESVNPDPLFAQILDRRSNKEAFDTTRPVSEMDVDRILSAAERKTITVGKTMDAKQIGVMRTLTREALLVEMYTYRTNKESIDVMRFGKAEIEANPDGIDMGGVFLETLSHLGQLSPEDLVNPESTAFKNGIPIILEPLESAMGYVHIKTVGNSRKDQIEAGRSYVRMNLKATELGISMHPLSQALQEYEEMKEHFSTIKTELDVRQEETLQMFARIGYGEKPNPSPRWNYEAKLRST